MVGALAWRPVFGRTQSLSFGRVLGDPRLLGSAGWLLIFWIVVFWRLGYPSFWDPDEAHYAETSREMLQAREWLVPLYDGQPFFDKPVLFHTFQMASFALFGATEFAARIVPALATIALMGTTAWLGAALFGNRVGTLAALMLAVLPATFALSDYAILDMLFTAFLFGGWALLWVAALRDRHRLQYPGYVLIALSILTKGPLGLALTVLGFGCAALLSADARTRFFRLHWIRGFGIIVVIASPWFLWMWYRFGDAFVDGYLLRENIWLFARSPYRSRATPFYYIQIMVAGMLPWTPILVGRLVDVVRGRGVATGERVLWGPIIAVVGFFTFSQFKLDHYIFPVAPPLCLLAAVTWRDAGRIPLVRQSLGTALGVLSTAILLIGVGIWMEYTIRQLPLDFSIWVKLLPLGFIVGGLVAVWRTIRNKLRAPRFPLGVAGAMLCAYAVVIAVGFPSFERAKPIKNMARWVYANTTPQDHIASFRLNRWKNSWRFYLERPSASLETIEDVNLFRARPGRHFYGMIRRDYVFLRRQGIPLRVVYAHPGLFSTTGRALRQKRRDAWRNFVVATDATDFQPR